MSRAPLLPLLLTLLLAPPLAAAAEGPDFVVEMHAVGDPTYDGPAGLARLVEMERGERYVWNLTLAKAYTVGEFRVRGGLFDIERVRQVVPRLEGIPDNQYPLFEPFPDDKLWTADGPAQVFHYNGSAGNFDLRLGFVGPANVTLVLQRDVTKPAYTMGTVTNVTTIGFYQETRTDELAIADLRIRPRLGGEWVENPTPAYHFLQRFPIQGLDADTEYEAQVAFVDWAGNLNVSPVYHVRTAPLPPLPRPNVTALEPAPNATGVQAGTLIRAVVESPQSPIQGGDIRFFLDKREVREGLRFDGREFSYQPPQPLEPGLHTAAVEVTNAAGGKGVARWSFIVGQERTPGLEAPLVVLGVVAVALARRLAVRRE